MRAWFVLLAACAALALAAMPDSSGCPAGYFFWQSEGAAHCQICQPGCACPGGWLACIGCSDGSFSAAPGAAACAACPPGSTSDAVYNAGCDPENVQTPCANAKGPLGQVACRPAPPPPNVTFVVSSGTLVLPPQYLPGGPPYVPNEVPPYYDDGTPPRPMVQQSY